MERELLTARLTKSVLLSEKTKHLEFEVEGVDRFDFVAGQFVSVREPKADGKFVTRAYSIASGPRGDNTFDLCLNRVEEGFMSNYLCDREIGDRVRFHGPHGHFILQPERRDTLFIATGTGIAPFRSMAEWLFSDASHHDDRHFYLVYGTRYPEDVYYQEQFEKLAAEQPNFHYIATLSRGPESWTGQRGYVQEHVRKIVGQRTDMEAYICGLNDMVSAVRNLLKDEVGWDKKHIIFERYD
ncbi:MAG TPA: FAD-binding oxidoreductase [Terriglobales bacterium]